MFEVHYSLSVHEPMWFIALSLAEHIYFY